MRIIGIDPGVRNLGLAWLEYAEAAQHRKQGTALYAINGPDEALERICAYIGSPVIPTVLAVEGWGNYGPRRGAFAMLKVIGGVHGIGAARGYQVLEFAPKEKARVSRKLARPVGMSDHEFDALCITYLAKEKLWLTSPSRKPLSSTSSARGSKGTSPRSSPSGRSGSGNRKTKRS